MGDPIAQSFLNELADAERELALGGIYDFDKNLELLVQAILSYAGPILDVPHLDSKAQASEAIDVDALRRAVEGLDNDAVRQARLDVPGIPKPLVASEDLAETKRMVEVVADAAANQHRFETGARLEFGLALPFLRLQIEVADQPALLKHLEDPVRAKIALLGEAEVRRLWAMATGEFQLREARVGAPPMRADKDVLGDGFFDPASIDDMRERVVRYAVYLKPLLARRMFESGIDSLRSALPSVPQLLALREVEALTLQDRRVLECLLRIYRAWGHEHEDRFAGALGVKKPHWPGRAAQLDRTLSRHKKTPAEEDRKRVLLLSLRRLLNFTESFVSVASSVERALVQYKLGLEVMLPESRKTVSAQIELKLQKDLCRFLLEREIRAFGKLFGRAEVDLLAEIPGERFLIETKKLRTVNCRGIDRNVTQLMSYMDQEESATRGVLVIYNLSDTLIVAERRWFRQRLWLLPINLCVASPSKMRKRLCIEDGGEDSILRCLPSMEATPIRRARRGRRTRR